MPAVGRTEIIATIGLITAGIIGYRGYTGEELQKLLARHPRVSAVLIDQAAKTQAASAAAESLTTKARQAARQAMSQAGRRSFPNPPVRLARDVLAGPPLDVVFLATPPEASVEWVPRFLRQGSRAIDLSSAFRIASPDTFARWYGTAHPCPEWLAEAVYGLTEVYRGRIATARLVANPGCYATAAALALRPLERHGLIDKASLVVCDAKTGVSGAGNKATQATHFCSVDENYSVYGTMNHRHVAEIVATTEIPEERFCFSTQLMPLRRGIMACLYFRLREGADAAGIEGAYLADYENDPFIALYPEGSFPSVASVSHTNFCCIGYSVTQPGNRAIVVAVIDNLVKGASGQAVQNMNAMFGFPETEGLP